MLNKINKDDLIFTGGNESGQTNTLLHLTLDDYDWMNYNIETIFRTEEMGTLEVSFEYFGTTSSTMSVKQVLNGIIYEYNYFYPTDIFKKNIIKFLDGHIKQWENTYAFDGEEYVINFFNEVLNVGELKK